MLLEVLLLGGLMGILGQGARAVVGLKGMADSAKALDLSPTDLFEAARLIVSILIGFLVGLAAALIYIKTTTPLTEPNFQALVGFAASGYVGVDFLEGFISQYLPQGGSGSTAPKFTDAQFAAIKATIEQLPKPAAQKPPTFSQADAQNYVFKAFAALGFTAVKTTDPLAQYNFDNDIALQGLARQINKLLLPKYGIPDDVAWGWNGENVSDVVTSVQYVQPVPVAAA
jgi:hypothetical protein